MRLSRKELSLFGELSEFPYETLIHRIIVTNIIAGKIEIPLKGTYHLICVRDDSKYPKFYRYTYGDITSMDVPTSDIMDGIFHLDITFKDKFEELKGIDD